MATKQKQKQKRTLITREIFQKVRSLIEMGVSPASIAKTSIASYQSAWRVSKCPTWADYEKLKVVKLQKFYELKGKNKDPGLFPKEPAKLVEACKHFWVESRFLQGRFFCARCLDQTEVKKLLPEWEFKGGTVVLPIEKPEQT